MPEKTAPINTRGFWEFLFLLFVLLSILAILSSASKNPPPSRPPQATSPPCTPIAGTPAPEVEVFVTPINDNKFDSFDIRGAVVRVSNSCLAASGSDGHLKVPCPSGESMGVWAPGYAIATLTPCDVQKTTYPITLTHLDAIDNTNYIWSSAATDCIYCHSNRFYQDNRFYQGKPNPPSFDEMNEWFRSGHAKVFNGGYFESMYKGTSKSGKPSIPAQPVIIDNEWVPVPPEKSLDYFGPGFQLDFPGQAGNCAYCHVPASISAFQESMNLTNLFPNPGSSWGEGVTCDICHKVFSISLADDKFPFPDRPGVLSYRFLRPNSGSFITGPFANIFTLGVGTIYHRSTCSPLFSQSEFCAACHFGKFGEMVVYNSYGEWKASPYAANPADTGYRTCQDCHMSHLYPDQTAPLSSQRQACSAANTAFQNFDHNMMDLGVDGILSREIPRIIRGAAKIDVTFGSQPATTNTLDVNVTVTNTRAGHKFPTDSPLRHLILVVNARDRVGTPLVQVGGDRIPKWAGPGPISKIVIARNLIDPGIPDYGGSAGKIFANLLVEEETNLSPAMAYWNETKYASVDSVNGTNSDTRLVPGKPDLSTYSFAMPDAGDVKVTVQLFYRYAFYDLMVWKEWYDRPDILVTSVECLGSPNDLSKMRCQKVATPTP